MELDTSSVAGFMTSRIYFEFPDRSIYIEIWLLLLILAAVVLSVVAVCLAVRANRKESSKKSRINFLLRTQKIRLSKT